MKRLLVGSVFAPSPRNAVWYDLQMRFLRKTLGKSFDHIVYLNRIHPDIFTDSVIVGAVPPERNYDYDELENGMVSIMKYFHAHPDYEYYLILDSDAFPFRENWIEDLVDVMKPIPALDIPQRTIAAPVRAENLDSFPHACVFFIDGDYLRSIPPGHLRLTTLPLTNFAGFTIGDLAFDDVVARDDDGRQTWCPLIRSNTWNPHPIVSAVYGHMFYHHGAGSRIPEFRVVQTGLFRHYMTEQQHAELEEDLFAALVRDPESLLLELAATPEMNVARIEALR